MVKTGTFMGGYKPRPYEVDVYFYVAQTTRFMGGHTLHTRCNACLEKLLPPIIDTSLINPYNHNQIIQ